MDTKEAAPAAPAAEAAPVEMVKLVNTGKGIVDIEGGRLFPNSQNAISVPKPVADRLRRAYAHIKNVADIFPESADVESLRKENEALRSKAASMEKLLGISDTAKSDAEKKFSEEKAEAQSAIDELVRLKDEAIGRANAAEAKLADAAPAPDAAALQATVTDLQGRLREFIEAKKMKDIEALQDKHADAVPTAEAAA